MTNQEQGKKTIGVVVSSKCEKALFPTKRWFYAGKFLRAYHALLAAHYKIVAPDETVGILNTSLEGGEKDSALPTPLSIEPLGDQFQGVVRLAAMVATGEVKRVLMFQDPRDLEIERPENYALLRNCNINGRHLYINAAAHLWALYECKVRCIPQNEPYETEPFELEDVKETVAFIAHDDEKPRMARFALHYRDVLRRFPKLIATSGTKRFIDKFLTNSVPPWDRLKIQSAGAKDNVSHGPSGGDVIIAEDIFKTYGSNQSNAVANRVLHHILFFIDHKHTHPHESDIQVLLKTCVNPLHRVNLILNSRMAEEWAERYRLR